MRLLICLQNTQHLNECYGREATRTYHYGPQDMASSTHLACPRHFLFFRILLKVQWASHIRNTHRMSVNDITSGILTPALQVRRLRKGNQTNNYGGALKQRKIGTLVYFNEEISYSIVSIFLFSSNLCCVTTLELMQ